MGLSISSFQRRSPPPTLVLRNPRSSDRPGRSPPVWSMAATLAARASKLRRVPMGVAGQTDPPASYLDCALLWRWVTSSGPAGAVLLPLGRPAIPCRNLK